MLGSPHGSYRVSIVDRVVCSTVIGSWNVEGMHAYLNEFRDLVKPLIVEREPWASMVDLRGWLFSTPDTIEPFNKTAHWAAANQRTHMAIVAEETQLMQWLVENFLKNTAVDNRFFSSRVAAWEWLRELRFCDNIPLLVHV